LIRFYEQYSDDLYDLKDVFSQHSIRNRDKSNVINQHKIDDYRSCANKLIKTMIDFKYLNIKKLKIHYYYDIVVEDINVRTHETVRICQNVVDKRIMDGKDCNGVPILMNLIFFKNSDNNGFNIMEKFQEVLIDDINKR